jgi:hypothetical protein
MKSDFFLTADDKENGARVWVQLFVETLFFILGEEFSSYLRQMYFCIYMC